MPPAARPARAAPAAAPAPNKPAALDSNRLSDLVARLRKLMGEPDHVTMTVSKTLALTATYPSGSLTLRDEEAVLDPPARPWRATMPFAVLATAIGRRGEVKMIRNEHSLLVKGTRFNAELRLEPTAEEVKFEPIKGIDSNPLKELLAQPVGRRMLDLRDSVETNKAIDVHFHWDANGITAAVADSFHGVIITGPVQHRSNQAHQITLPIGMATKLVEIGGEFELGSNKIQAQSALGQAELLQTGQTDSAVAMRDILSLRDIKPVWRLETSADELNNLLGSLSVMLENSRVEIKVNASQLQISANGRYGKVNGALDYKTTGGKPPQRLTLNPRTFNPIIGQISGNVRLTLLEKILRIEPVVQGDWKVTGFVFLLADAVNL